MGIIVTQERDQRAPTNEALQGGSQDLSPTGKVSDDAVAVLPEIYRRQCHQRRHSE